MSGATAGVILSNITSTAAAQNPVPILVNPINVTTVATPSANPIVLNPFLDIAPFHFTQFLWLNTLPLWAIIGAILFFYWAWYNLKWMKKCGSLSACYGYKDALMNGSISAQQTIVFTKSRKWFIRMLTYHSEGILYFQNLMKTDMWHMGASSEVGTLGGLSAAITKDNFDEVVDPIADIALCTVCDRFNHGDFGDEKNRKRASQETKMLTFERFNGTECDMQTAIAERMLPDSISDFKDFIALRPVLETIWPDGIKIACYTIYDPYASDKFTPKQRSASLFGGLILQKARDFASENIPELGFWDRNGIAMILILGGVIIMGASYFATR